MRELHELAASVKLLVVEAGEIYGLLVIVESCQAQVQFLLY